MRRQPVVTVNARYLFDEVNLALDIEPMRGQCDLPTLRPRLGGEFQRRENTNHFLVGYVDSQDPLQRRPPQQNRGPFDLARIRIHHAPQHAAATHHAEQRRQPFGGPCGRAHVCSAREAVRGVGVHCEVARGAANRGGVEPSGLEQHVTRPARDLGLLAAHHAGQSHRTLPIGNHQVIRGELSVDAVEGAQALARLRPPYDDLRISKQVEIESVRRVPHFEQHVVRQISDVVDAADAAQLDAVAHPLRGRLDFHAERHPARVTRAQVRVGNLDRRALGGRWVRLGNLRRRTLQRAAV